jgi:cytochrome P450 StaP
MSDLDAGTFHSLILDNIEDPYPVYRGFREADGLHRVLRPGTGREPEWLVMRYDEAATVLGGRGFGRRAAVAGVGPATAVAIVPPQYVALSALVDNWLVFMDPPRHTRVRAVVADCFAKRLRPGIYEQIREIVEELVYQLLDKPRIELVGDFAATVPMLVMLEVLGVPQPDREWLLSQTAALQQASNFHPGRREPRLAIAEAAACALDEYFRAVLAQRRKTPGNDLMSALVTAEWDDILRTDELLVGTCVHLLAAGHETTRNALSKAALLLLRHADVLDQLRARPELVSAAVDELIRFDSPVQMITRWAYQDEQMGGHDIHRGDKVTVVLGSVNRDPARFDRPDTIRFDRDNRQHCGFGMGAHYCLGSVLGRKEVQVGLAALLKLLPGLRIGSDAVPYGKDLVFHGPQRLPLIQSA